MTYLVANASENPISLPLDGLFIATLKSKKQLSSGEYKRSPIWSSQGSWEFIDETLFWDKNGNGLHVLIANSKYSNFLNVIKVINVIKKHQNIPSCKKIAFSEIKAIGLEEAKQEFPDINPEVYYQTEPTVNDEDLVVDKGSKPTVNDEDLVVDKGSNRIDPLFSIMAKSDKKVMKEYSGMASILNGSSCCPGGCTPDDSFGNQQFCKTCGFSVFLFEN